MLGIAGLYLSVLLFRLTGKLLGGRASALELRAAIAWSARTTLDLALLSWQTSQGLVTATAAWPRNIAVFALLTAALAVGVFLRTPLQKLLFTSILLISFAALAWAVANARHARIVPVPERLG